MKINKLMIAVSTAALLASSSAYAISDFSTMQNCKMLAHHTNEANAVMRVYLDRVSELSKERSIEIQKIAAAKKVYDQEMAAARAFFRAQGRNIDHAAATEEFHRITNTFEASKTRSYEINQLLEDLKYGVNGEKSVLEKAADSEREAARYRIILSSSVYYRMPKITLNDLCKSVGVMLPVSLMQQMYNPPRPVAK